MDEEMKSLITNQAYDLVLLPKEKKTLDNKWMYMLKEEHDGIKRYKVRLVVKRCQQRKYVNYSKLLSPVVKMITIRLVLSIMAVEDLHLE